MARRGWAVLRVRIRMVALDGVRKPGASRRTGTIVRGISEEGHARQTLLARLGEENERRLRTTVLPQRQWAMVRVRLRAPPATTVGVAGSR